MRPCHDQSSRSSASSSPYLRDGLDRTARDSGGIERHPEIANGAKNASDAGIWSIEHGNALTDGMHKLMAQKGIWRA
jgi:imidazolonepropionase-like amidohydrolase